MSSLLQFIPQQGIVQIYPTKRTYFWHEIQPSPKCSKSIQYSFQFNVHRCHFWLFVVVAIAAALCVDVAFCYVWETCVFSSIAIKIDRPKKRTKERKNIFIINEFIYNMFLFFLCSMFTISILIPHTNHSIIFCSYSTLPLIAFYAQMYSPFFSVCILWIGSVREDGGGGGRGLILKRKEKIN